MCTEDNEKIVAGIVLYQPEIRRLKENIDSIWPQVDRLYLVDNGSDNIVDIIELVSRYQGIKLIRNKENRGIAAALNQIMDAGICEGAGWVLTLDQDSVCDPGLIEVYRAYLGTDRAGIITCNIVDRNYHEPNTFAEGERWKEIPKCITSGSLTSVQAYMCCEGFEEKLFIDWVDFEFCFHLRRKGFRVIRVNYDGLLHEMGKGRDVRLFGKPYVAYNHPPIRNYYFARNHFYLVRKYPDMLSARREWLRELRAEAIILLYEKQKWTKLRERWRGMKDSRKMG